MDDLYADIGDWMFGHPREQWPERVRFFADVASFYPTNDLSELWDRIEPVLGAPDTWESVNLSEEEEDQPVYGPYRDFPVGRRRWDPKAQWYK